MGTPHLLGAAFDLRDPEMAEKLADAVIAEGPSEWKVESTLSGLMASPMQVDDAKRTRLAAVIDKLKTA